MYNGVKAMIDSDKSMRPLPKVLSPTECGSHLKTVDDI
jgi:hypothetical protein